MQLRPGVAGPVRQPPRKHTGLHAEVAAVLLHHDVGGHLARRRRAECLRWSMDIVSSMPCAVVGVATGRLPSASPFSTSGSRFGRVAVHLVGGREDEHGVRAVLARRLQQVQVPVALTAKSVSGSRAGPVVRGLGRGVHHQLDRRRPYCRKTLLARPRDRGCRPA